MLHESCGSQLLLPCTAAIVATPHKLAGALAMQPTRLAIIGTAGRKEDARKMSAAVFSRMMDHAALVQQSVWKLPNERVILVSGGSAWADHVAVKLFLREAMNPDGSPYAGLHLFMPCELNFTGSGQARAADSGSSDWRNNPGRVLNQLHASFTRAIGSDTLNEVALARSFGAKLCFDGRGFHPRNKLVAAQADRMLAFTWGNDPAQPKDGGTMHTWKLATAAIKLHVPLAPLMSSSTVRQAASTSAPLAAAPPLPAAPIQTPSSSLVATRSAATAAVDKLSAKRKSAAALCEQASPSTQQRHSMILSTAAAAGSSPKRQRTNTVLCHPLAPAISPPSSSTCSAAAAAAAAAVRSAPDGHIVVE